jgi:hypothetical protein
MLVVADRCRSPTLERRLAVPERPKKSATSPPGPMFAEQCIGTHRRGRQFMTVKIDFDPPASSCRR